MKIFSFLIIFFILYPSSAFCIKKALVIGVGNYRSLPTVVRGKVLHDLKGPRNDVKLIKNVLISYGFKSSNIKVLLDEKATKKNIWRTFNEWLIKGTKAGDEVVFYFSGHGTQVTDQDHDETDGWDETLCPYDIDPKTGDNAIIDDEFAIWLKMLKKRYVTVIIDSCYSGGATRSIGNIIVDELEPTPAVRSRHIAAIYNWKPTSSMTFRGLGGITSDYPDETIFLGASLEGQEAFERRIDPNHTYGSFTYSLAEALRTLKDPTYEMVFKITRKEIRNKIGLAQTPVLIAKNNLKKRLVFGGRSIKNNGKINKQNDISNPLVSNFNTYKTKVEHQQLNVKKIKLWVAIGRIKGLSRSEINYLKSSLQSIPYVKIARPSQFFDRLIRGKKQNGKFMIRLLNQLGDREKIVAGSIHDLMRWLKYRLRYAWMVKRLANIENPNPDFRVTLKVTDKDRTDFFLGEQISFKITSEKDAYIMLISVDSRGTYHIIFPNRFCKNNFIKANSVITIPDKTMRASYFKEHKTYFKFVLTPPAGEEMIKVIATDKPLRIEDLGIGDFNSLFNNSSGIAEISRGIAGTLINSLSDHLNSGKISWSEDRVIIRSYKPRI